MDAAYFIQVNRCIGIIRTNGISVTSVGPESKLRCVYPSVSLLSHGCAANARSVAGGCHQAKNSCRDRCNLTPKVDTSDSF